MRSPIRLSSVAEDIKFCPEEAGLMLVVGTQDGLVRIYNFRDAV